jgi:hypothetical protein
MVHMQICLLGRFPLLAQVVVTNLLTPKRPRVILSFAANLAILLVAAGNSLMPLLVASVARKATRPMCALTTSLMHQQMLLKLF